MCWIYVVVVGNFYKVNETWSNDTVSFYQTKRWHFEESMSSGSMDDIVISINMISVSAAEYARYREDFYTTKLNDLINLVEESGLFLLATVREWTFDGILDGILGTDFPDDLYLPIPFNRFGWFYPVAKRKDFMLFVIITFRMTFFP